MTSTTFDLSALVMAPGALNARKAAHLVREYQASLSYDPVLYVLITPLGPRACIASKDKMLTQIVSLPFADLPFNEIENSVIEVSPINLVNEEFEEWCLAALSMGKPHEDLKADEESTTWSPRS